MINKSNFTDVMNENDTMEKVRRHCIDKNAWDEYRKMYQESKECVFTNVLPYPIQIEIELNGTCNYRCQSCNYRMDIGSDKRPTISLETFTELVKDGVPKGLKVVRFNHHNEPLLKRDIGDYIRVAKQNGILDTYLSTNGSMLDDEMIESLIDSGLDRLQVSIDAMTEKTYTMLRPGGDFNKVISNTKKFLKIRNERNKELPTLRVNFVKQKENVNELDSFVEYWKTEGVDSIGVQKYSDWQNVKEDGGYEDLEFHCSFPYNLLVVRYTGDVLACCMFFSDKMVIGNIYKNSISEMWNGSVMQNLRRLSESKDGWKKHPICRKCVKSIVTI